jgi:predicted kinase
MRRAVLVNGVSATGKSTIALAIGARLEIPVLSLDRVKEALYDELGNAGGDREYGRTLGRASMKAIWSLIADFPADSAVVVEAWFRMPPHEHIVAGLERAGIGRWAEVWCHAAPEILADRYGARVRHPGHPPASEYAAELAQLAGVARPIALASVLSVDTSDFASVDLDAIASWVREALGLPSAAG